MPLPDAFTQALAARFGKRFSTAEAVRAHHGHDESHFADALPEGVDAWIGVAAAFDALFLGAGIILFGYIYAGED